MIQCFLNSVLRSSQELFIYVETVSSGVMEEIRVTGEDHRKANWQPPNTRICPEWGLNLGGER